MRWLIESEEGDIFLTALIIIPMIIAVMILIFTQVDNIYVMLDGMRRIYEQRLLKRCEERIIKEWHIINYIRNIFRKSRKSVNCIPFLLHTGCSNKFRPTENLNLARNQRFFHIFEISYLKLVGTIFDNNYVISIVSRSILNIMKLLISYCTNWLPFLLLHAFVFIILTFGWVAALLFWSNICRSSRVVR